MTKSIPCILLIILAQFMPALLPAQGQGRISFDALENRDDIYYYKGKPFTGTSVEMFGDSRVKKQELNWVNGLLHGQKIEYFTTGFVRARINFEYGKRNGSFTYWYNNGQVKETAFYINDILNDTLTSWYENGVKHYQYTYRMGTRVGKGYVWFFNGNLSQEISYRNGKPDGLLRTYYEAGNLRYEGYYTEGVRNGRYTTYHINGLKAEESYYKNGEQDSVSYFWDNINENLIKQEYYKMGKRDGEWITFSPGNDTLTLYNYKDGVLDGPYRIWSANPYAPAIPGVVTKKLVDETGNYSNGKLDGPFKTGLVNRKTHAEGFYTNGKQTGEWNYYNENNKLVLQETYDETGELLKVKLRRKFLFFHYYQSETDFSDPDE